MAHPPRLRNHAGGSNDSVDSHLLKDNKLDLIQSQSVLMDLVPGGSSVEEGPI